MEEIRVRFAPSPTGELHIGGARTCLFNWLFARHYGGKFILRIEDTDLDRLKEGSIDGILNSLKWLGIDWDEGPLAGGTFQPYFQSQRLSLYSSEADKLLNEGKAYQCYCTQEDLDNERKLAAAQKRPYKYSGKCKNLSLKKKEAFINAGRKPVVRFSTPSCGSTIVNDIVRGDVSFENSLIDDFIIIKSNGVAAYNFACVIDDFTMRISHVIRAEEHLSNTPKQLLLYAAIGAPAPKFAHVPMILAPDRSKLSKRHGATSVEEFISQGFLPEALINYICLLGWAPKDHKEIISKKSMIEEFSLDRVSKNPAIYDTKKMSWINGHYLRSYNIDKLMELIIPFLHKKGIHESPLPEGDIDREKLKKAVLLVREKVWNLEELANGLTYFFHDIPSYDEKGVEKYFKNEASASILNEMLKHFKEIEDFTEDVLENCVRSYAQNHGIKAGEVIHPLRLALTGRCMTPGLFEVMSVLGKEMCVSRIETAVKFIKNLM